MDQVSLRASTGREIGSAPSRRMRAEGIVPAVLYGRGIEAAAIAVDRRELYGALHTGAGLNAIIYLDVDGTEHTTVAREVQRHPWRGEITHLDFIRISLDEEIEAEVGIEFLGTPAGIADGGIVETVQTSVMISSLPGSIPQHISVDISALGIGDSLKVEDLPTLEGVEYLTDLESTLVTVVIPAALMAEGDGEEVDMLEGEDADGGADDAADGDSGEDEG